MVICTYNRAAELNAVLRALSHQLNGPAFEWRLLVVDNASTDDTATVVERHRKQAGLLGLSYVYEAKPGLTAARHRGMMETDAPWVAFVDDDNHLTPGWLDAMASAIRSHPAAGGIGGAVVLDWETPPPSYLDGFGFCFAEQLGGETDRLVDSLAGAGMVLRREAVVKSGWLDCPLIADRVGKKLVSGGDVELAQRVRAAGYELWVTSKAVLHHRIPVTRMTRRYLLRMNFELGVSSALIALLTWPEDWYAWQVMANGKKREWRRTVTSIVANAVRRRSNLTGALAWASFARGFGAGVRRCHSFTLERRAELIGAARITPGDENVLERNPRC